MKGSKAKSFILGNILVVLFIYLSVTSVHAQWAYTYGGTGYDYAYSINLVQDGGYIIAGRTASFGAGGTDAWLIKLDAGGNVAWQKTYGGGGDDYLFDIRQTGDGGYIAAGYTNSFGAGSNDVWLIKLNSSGNVVWEKTYGGTGDDSAFSVRQTQDGGFIVVGGTSSFGAGGGDFWLLKLDGNGNVVWEKAYGGTGYDYALSVSQTSDNGYIAAGYTSSFGVMNYGFWVLKLDENGAIAWQKAYGGTGYDYARSIHQTGDGGYIVAGSTTSFGAGNYDFWVLKLDENGAIAWQKTYGGTGYDYNYSIYQTADEGYIATGVTRSFGAGNDDFWLLKLTGSGNVTWQRTFGGTGYDSAYSVIQLQDNTFAAAGSTSSSGAGDQDLWFLKLDANGSVGSCPFEGVSTASIADSSATAVDTDAATITSTATVTDITSTATSTSVSPGIVCSSGETFLKVGFERKRNGDGVIASLDDLIACPEACQAGYSHGFRVTLTAAPVPLSTFLGWKPSSLGCLTPDPCQVTMDKKKSVKAVFQGPNKLKTGMVPKNKGEGTVVGGDGLINCPGDCEESYTIGTSVTLIATPDTLSTFLKWTGTPCAKESSNVCTFTMDKDYTVKPMFQGPNKLKVGVISKNKGAGTVVSGDALVACPGDCEEFYTVGDTVSLTATPTLGTFLKWSGIPCMNEPSNVCNFKMDKNYTVNAIFQGN